VITAIALTISRRVIMIFLRTIFRVQSGGIIRDLTPTG
jgi:hypothetical protein